MGRFCRGEHPCFNGVAPNPLAKFDGSKGGKDFRITTSKGAMFRFDSLDDTAMIVGTFERVLSTFAL